MSLLTPEQSAGAFGKIPARGDFVSFGLPPHTVKAWDRFISAALADAKAAHPDRWTDIWLEAPVWRFALPATMCGASPLLGLWMPSIDKAGRHFPLMIAATCPGATPEQMARHGTAWLYAAEDAGRAAIADDLTPGQLTALIPPPPGLTAMPETALCTAPPPPGAGLWSTAGGPHVPAQALVLTTMPDSATFLAMLDAAANA